MKGLRSCPTMVKTCQKYSAQKRRLGFVPLSLISLCCTVYSVELFCTMCFCFREDHKGHEKKIRKLQTVFKKFKQEVAVAIETIDGKIRDLKMNKNVWI